MTHWAVLAAIVFLCVGADLIAHRGDRVDSRRGAIAWTAMWIGVSVAFGLWLTLHDGASRGAEFFSAYLVEKSLSVDNLLVFLLIFSRLQIPPAEQRPVLFWGIFGALVMRGVFIAAGAAAVTRWHFVLYGFGLVLVVTGLRLACRAPSSSEPRIVAWLRRAVPLTRELVGHRFLAKEDGRRAATPLLLALLTVELTDVVFAIDSIPAAFGVTREPFILYSSNILAVLGLRALFVVVATVLRSLRFLRFGIAAILIFVGGKMLVTRWVDVAPGLSLLVIVAVMAATAIVSLRSSARAGRTEAST